MQIFVRSQAKESEIELPKEFWKNRDSSELYELYEL